MNIYYNLIYPGESKRKQSRSLVESRGVSWESFYSKLHSQVYYSGRNGAHKTKISSIGVLGKNGLLFEGFRTIKKYCRTLNYFWRDGPHSSLNIGIDGPHSSLNIGTLFILYGITSATLRPRDFYRFFFHSTVCALEGEGGIEFLWGTLRGRGGMEFLWGTLRGKAYFKCTF